MWATASAVHRYKSITYLHGVQMALDGKERILGWHSFVGNLVAKDRLVRLLDAEIRLLGAFFDLTNGQKTRLFADGLMVEARAGQSAQVHGQTNPFHRLP